MVKTTFPSSHRLMKPDLDSYVQPLHISAACLPSLERFVQAGVSARRHGKESLLIRRDANPAASPSRQRGKSRSLFVATPPLPFPFYMKLNNLCQISI